MIIVDRAASRCWLMGRLVPRSALTGHVAYPVPRQQVFRESALLAAAGGVTVAYTWSDDASGWDTSDGGAGGGDGGGGGDG